MKRLLSVRKKAYLLLLMLSTLSCSSASSGNPECSKVIFAENPHSEIRRVINTCTPLEQLDLYLASIYMAQPQSKEVAQDIVDTGEGLVAPVLLKLDRNNGGVSENAIAEIIFLLYEMNSHETYDVENDLNLFKASKRSIEAIRNEEIRLMAMDSFKAIWGEKVNEIKMFDYNCEPIEDCPETTEQEAFNKVNEILDRSNRKD